MGGKVSFTVEDIAFGGDGVGRVNDFVVFVPWVAPGETVEAEVTEVKRNFARARLLRVLKPSPARVTPECRYFGECGGCQYQHVAYAAQLELKHKQVTDLVQRLGGFAPEGVAPVVPCPQPYGYRNRLMIRSQWDRVRQRLNIGFLRADSRLVVDITECRIADSLLNEQLRRLRAQPPPRGGLKVVLRVAPEGWDVPPDSFFQNNSFMLPQLVATVRERLADGGVRFLVDAYCGVGFFSLELATAVEYFVGVELDALAVRAARRNAAARGHANGEFILGRTEDYLPNILARFNPRATAVLLDPPRTGCARPGLELLRQSGLAQVLYVSCHPATLARDLNVLCAGGVFELKRVVPLDLFPQTQHVECVADLRRRPNQALPAGVPPSAGS